MCFLQCHNTYGVSLEKKKDLVLSRSDYGIGVSGMHLCKGVKISCTPIWKEVLVMGKGVAGDRESEGSP